MISAKIWPENGATSDGFSTMVQPVASAGATLQAIWFSGQFHGVIRPQTPIGSLTISVAPRCSSNSKFFEHLDGGRARWPMPIGPGRAAASAGRRAHFLGDRVGEVAEALLVLGQDRLQHLQALLAAGLRPGR